MEQHWESLRTVCVCIVSQCVYTCVYVRVELMGVHMFHLEGTAPNSLLFGYLFVSRSLSHAHTGAPLGLRFRDYVSGTWGTKTTIMGRKTSNNQD